MRAGEADGLRRLRPLAGHSPPLTGGDGPSADVGSFTMKSRHFYPGSALSPLPSLGWSNIHGQVRPLAPSRSRPFFFSQLLCFTYKMLQMEAGGAPGPHSCSAGPHQRGRRRPGGWSRRSHTRPKQDLLKLLPPNDANVGAFMFDCLR